LPALQISQRPGNPVLFTPGQNIDSYLSAISQLSHLDADEELALARRLTTGEDLDAARQLMLSQLRFVASVAKRYTGYGLPLADLIQEGNMGLMKAIKGFNPDAGVRLVSYSVHYIKAEIHEYVIRNWRTVRIATTKPQRKLFFNLRKHKTHSGWLSQDEALQMAGNLGVTLGDVIEMEGRIAGNDVSFDSDTDADDDEAYLAPAHNIADYRYDPARTYEDETSAALANSNLYDAMASLDERSRDIISQRWLSNEKATLQDLALKHNVSAERIRQLEKSAMRKLRSILPMAA